MPAVLRVFTATIALLAAVVVALASAPAAAAPRPNLWPFWDLSNEQNLTRIDHSRWQWFLDRYVQPGGSGVNLIAYPRVDIEGRTVLDAYLHSLAVIDPRTYRRAEQFAYWINLYNALTIDVVLRHPEQKSIVRMGTRLLSTGPWDDELTTIAGQRITLNDIEHRILRPIWRDHRIHYAVNCASLGCPNLFKLAFTAANAETLLDAGEMKYINHPRGVRFDDRGRLYLSSIYQWYARDFARDDQSLLRYLAAHHTTRAAELSDYRGRIRYAYDWSLNQLD
jgi:hypothetical protein